MTGLRSDLAAAVAALFVAAAFAAPAWGQSTESGPVRLIPLPDRSFGQPPVTNPGPSPQEPLPGAATGPPRTLGAIPPATGSVVTIIEEDTLPAPNSEWIGVLDDSRAGLGSSMWRGTKRAVVSQLLPQLPAAMRSRTARDLARRLLLTNAEAPDGTAAGDSLVTLRLDRLHAMGDFAGVADLLRVGPSGVADRRTARIQVESLLLAGDHHGACDAARRHIADHDSPFLHRTIVFCQALVGEHDRAALGLSLLEEDEQDRNGAGEAFATLVAAMAGDTTAVVDSMPAPRPITLAMMAAAAQMLPADVMNTDDPALLRAIAINPSAPLSLRLDAAERAALAGAMSTQALEAVYADISFGAAEFNGAGQISADTFSPESRALLYQAARREIDQVERARILQRIWHLARGHALRDVVAAVTAPVLQGVLPAPELLWFAPDAARALLAGGSADAAAGWFRLVDREAEADSMVVTDLWPLKQLSGGPAGGWDRATLERWAMAQRSLHGPDAQARIALLYGMVAGLGVNGPGRATWALFLPPPALAAVDAEPEAWRDVATAARTGRRGETVLRALIALGGRSASEAGPAELRVLLGALGSVGLETEARALAVEAAVGAGL